MADPHEYIFIDEAGFNLTKRPKRGRNILGHRAVTSSWPEGRQHHHMRSHQQSWRPPPPCQTGSIQLLQFLNPLHDNILQQEGEPGQPEQVQYVVIWDNVSFHHAALVHPWFNAHPRFTVLFFASIFPISESDWGIILRMAVKSIWPQPLLAPKPPGSNAGPVEMCLWSLYRVI